MIGSFGLPVGKGNFKRGSETLNGLANKDVGVEGTGAGNETGGGSGKWRRAAASFSPGDSKATAGRPYVAPSKLAKAPPRECPTSHMLDEGYICNKSSTSFCKQVLEAMKDIGLSNHSRLR